MLVSAAMLESTALLSAPEVPESAGVPDVPEEPEEPEEPPESDEEHAAASAPIDADVTVRKTKRVRREVMTIEQSILRTERPRKRITHIACVARRVSHACDDRWIAALSIARPSGDVRANHSGRLLPSHSQRTPSKIWRYAPVKMPFGRRAWMYVVSSRFFATSRNVRFVGLCL